MRSVDLPKTASQLSAASLGYLIHGCHLQKLNAPRTRQPQARQWLWNRPAAARKGWCGHWGSNPEPAPYKEAALTD